MDEERGFLLTSHEEGGIVATCLDSGDVLWALPPVSIIPPSTKRC